MKQWNADRAQIVKLSSSRSLPRSPEKKKKMGVGKEKEEKEAEERIRKVNICEVVKDLVCLSCLIHNLWAV